MGVNKFICYYSDLYKNVKKEISIRILVIDNKGHIIFRKNKKITDIEHSSLAKYIAFRELFSSLSELERSLNSKEESKIPIDIISFDKKIVPAFINLNLAKGKFKISNIEKLRFMLNSRTNWSIRYDEKSKEIFKKLYSQSLLGKNGKKLKGYKLPRKKQRIRKVQDAIGDGCESLAFFDVEMNCIDRKDNTLGYWEVVSIGVVKYHIKTKSVHKFYTVIKPKVQRILSERCIQITGLTQLEVDMGIDYKDAMKNMQRWLGDGKIVFMSWGREDIKALKSNSTLEGNHNQLIYQIRKNYVDFQKEFSYYHEGSNQVISLIKALSVYEEEFEGDQHNALNDAYNLYRVYDRYKKEMY
ncbi:3'-5' exonuclease [Clostridium cylindrosporum]|uniref:Exonuclease domain-containing protein n=1 Tax=Clostridium cylindrosporum DSM 605 TaxID=1121307 RepID=A0A0J8DAU2_CLOCY|nr:3'-5' exonuclease [Clostridium cylindrosporum]KMT23165.1 hypothetical protein CLCY_6c00460 [Clostridium cylindrosporum DSM 605]